MSTQKYLNDSTLLKDYEGSFFVLEALVINNNGASPLVIKKTKEEVTVATEKIKAIIDETFGVNCEVHLKYTEKLP